jgi:single-strand DNA-binding protein
MISFTGNVAFDPKLRTTAGGAQVLDIRVATTPRIKRGEEWEDGGTLWYDVVCWNKLAYNVNESVTKGDPVVVIGRLYNRVFDKANTETGEVTTVERLTVDAQSVGLDLNRFPAKLIRPERPEAALPQRTPPVVNDAVDEAA